MMAEMFFSPGCLFYAIMFILPPAEGAIKFTLKPPNPSYARNGTHAKLVWDYSVDNLQAELLGIIYAVEVSGGGFANMLSLQSDGTVNNLPSTPNEYKGRVRIEEKASLVIENITVQDNTQFKCTLVAKPGVGQDVVDIAQLIVIAAQIKFTSKYNGKTVTGLVGSSLNFTWSFSGGVDSVVWGLKEDGVDVIKNGGELVSLYKSGLVSVAVPLAYSGRVSGSGDASSGQVTFTLSSIRISDKGFYGCKIKPTDLFDQDTFDSVYLAVKEAPQISIPSVPASYNKGSSVYISCTASGTPGPDVQWIRNGNIRNSGKKTVFLMFSSVNRADGGQYTCRANNSAGNDEKHTTLVVHYPPTIKAATTSTNKSWIGQTVTLKCVSDGVPTPTLTWDKPDGSQINSIIATQITMNVTLKVDQDFGDYKCDTDNGVSPADFKKVKIEQIKNPGSPTIAQLDTQATSLTVKWTAPADDGGSSITAYRVVILKSSTEIKNENITDPGITSLSVGDLTRITNYTVKVFARNVVFEGPAVEMVVKTKYEVKKECV